MPSSSRDRLVRRAQSARVVAGVLSRTAVDTIGSALDRATGGPRQSAGDGAVAVDAYANATQAPLPLGLLPGALVDIVDALAVVALR